MVKLNEGGILKHVAPPQIGLVRHVAVERVEELFLRRCEAKTHPGELVVDEASIKTSNKSTGHGRREHQKSEAGDGTAEDAQGRVLQRLDLLCGLGRLSEHAMFLEDGEAGEDHGAVDGKCRAKMCREAILADSRVAARVEEVVLEPTLDHPPADDALEANHAADAHELPRRRGCHSSARDEVCGGEEEGDANDSAPQSVGPLHKVDLLELGQRHAGVELRELGRRTILVELALPCLWAAGPQRACDGAPFGDAQSGAISGCLPHTSVAPTPTL